MSNKESEKLNCLINLAIEKNDGEDNYNTPYGSLANDLKECELHFDYLMECPRKSQYNRIINYTFKVTNKEIQESLLMRKKYLIEMCEEILEDDYELPSDEDGYPSIDIKFVRAISKLATPPKTTFEKCADVIIRNIANAEHSILVAVAWFTNPNIMQALIKKSEEGLAIAIIVDAGGVNDTKNRDFIAKYPDLKFPIYFATNINWEYKNFMHHKFCIIDNQIVLHGTFNWTVKAQYNDEDVTEDKNETTVTTFVERFKELRKKYNCFCTYSCK